MEVLIVDDQPAVRHTMRKYLCSLDDIQIREAQDLAEAREKLKLYKIDVAFVDIRLDDLNTGNRDGLTLVREIREQTSAVPVIVTVSSEMVEVREALRHGAYDYILKSELCEDLVVSTIERIQSRRKLEQEVLTLRARVASGKMPGALIGASPAMEHLRNMIRRVATSELPVLVLGPTGAGKELVVQTTHAMGPNPEAPCLDINCGAIPTELIGSELFGHKKGAFTGASEDRQGYLSAVKNGTLFLDEIGELPLPLQTQLLRVLETREFKAIGSNESLRFSGRVVAATHRDLDDLVRQGGFREDLLHRLNVLTLRIPPLADRREDIPSLVAHFVSQQSRPVRFSREALDALSRMSFSGNVRELRNLVWRLAVMADTDLITPEVVTRWAQPKAPDSLRQVARSILDMDVQEESKLKAIESALISEALEQERGNHSAAGRRLGVHRKVVERWQKRDDDAAEDATAEQDR